MKSGVVLVKSGEKNGKSEKKLQKVNENNQHFIKPPRALRRHEENQLTVISEQLAVKALACSGKTLPAGYGGYGRIAAKLDYRGGLMPGERWTLITPSGHCSILWVDRE